jgi:hypothetical protein
MSPQSSFSFYADLSPASQNYADKKHDFSYFSVIDGRGLVVDFYVAMKTMVSYSSNLGKKPHYGTEVVLVREGPRAGGGSSQRKKGYDYFTSPVKTMTLRDIK